MRLAPGLGWLVTFRVVQAIGGSMLNPVAMSIVTNTFPDPRERARAIGIWGAVFGISLALGPVLGGLLVHTVGWRAIFWINVPVGLAGMALAQRFVPESRAPHPRRVDPVGQVLVVVLLAALSYAIIEGPSAGWGSPQIVGAFTVAGAALLGLLGYEPRRREPLIELRLFRSAPFSGATSIAVTALCALAGLLFLNTLYLQEVRGLSALHAGLYTLPTAAAMMVASPVSGRLVGAFGARIPLLIGGTAIAAGGVALTGLTTTTSTAMLLAIYALFGLGFGMVNAPITSTAVGPAPRPGRRGRRVRVDESPGRPDVGRRDHRHGRDRTDPRLARRRIRRGESPRLVDHRGVRRPDRGPRPGHDRALGAGHVPARSHAAQPGGVTRVGQVRPPRHRDMAFARRRSYDGIRSPSAPGRAEASGCRAGSGGARRRSRPPRRRPPAPA